MCLLFRFSLTAARRCPRYILKHYPFLYASGLYWLWPLCAAVIVLGFVQARTGIIPGAYAAPAAAAALTGGVGLFWAARTVFFPRVPVIHRSPSQTRARVALLGSGFLGLALAFAALAFAALAQSSPANENGGPGLFEWLAAAPPSSLLAGHLLYTLAAARLSAFRQMFLALLGFGLVYFLLFGLLHRMEVGALALPLLFAGSLLFAMNWFEWSVKQKPLTLRAALGYWILYGFIWGIFAAAVAAAVALESAGAGSRLFLVCASLALTAVIYSLAGRGEHQRVCAAAKG